MILSSTNLFKLISKLIYFSIVQTDLKKLLRNPPLVKVPKAADRLNVHPFFGPLPSTLRALLESSANEIIKAPGTTLYKEGSNANGIWLICNGVVKVSGNLHFGIGILKFLDYLVGISLCLELFG